MEDLKKSILDMMAVKLDDGLRLLENRVANVEVKQNNNNPENFQYQQLLDDLKQKSKLQFEKIQKEAEAMSIKNAQLELKISDLLKNMENLRKDEGDEEDQLQIQKEPEANQRQQMPDDRQNHEEVSMHEVYKYRKEMDEKNNMCHQLEREIKDLRKELEAKDIICQDLKLEVSQVRQHPEFILMRQQLLDDLKGQEELHLREVKQLRKQLEAKDNICYQLEIEISQVRENPEFLKMRQQLLDELKGQEELHLLEVNELRKELDEKDKICHQLENEMFGQENAELIHRNPNCPTCRAQASANDIRKLFTRS
ncbi:rab11 family-interacting protein 4A-like [Drosophila sulfurigaster albostrigata]|uniref:rab11 family-interacting protein 4A-like n=1 Tax=Drosophila sulfurigaster albostrigata TaxID=89887 RepID=UPI002D21E3DF|nr:rab11 family-interacting protein 4A-like [Drosophila sulfurigaster albostrigata]